MSNLIRGRPRIEEKGHAYQELPWQERFAKANVILDGYWQSEKYFKEFRNQIIAEFNRGFGADGWLPFSSHPTKDIVSFHIRRGDYLTLTRKHPPTSLEWMLKAMSKFPDYEYLFFSDDIPWCRMVFGGRDDCRFSDGTSEVADLIGMTNCEHHICSASTFSWWGAWLNTSPNKREIIPDWWFVGTSYKGLDTRDIVPPEWER